MEPHVIEFLLRIVKQIFIVTNSNDRDITLLITLLSS